MKSKSAVVTLSFLFGSTGAPRFFLGQNRAGWTMLLLCWVVLPALIYAIIRFNLTPNWEPLFFARVAIPIVVNLVETFRFALMKPEKFKSQDKSTRNTIPMTLTAIILGGGLFVAAGNILEGVGHVDITKADAEVTLSASEMSTEYRVDEVAYRKKYDNKVLQVEGELALAPGEDFETGTTYLELKGATGDAFGIKCFFLKENSGNVKGLQAGNFVVVKGECNGNILNNCLLVEVKK